MGTNIGSVAAGLTSAGPPVRLSSPSERSKSSYRPLGAAGDDNESSGPFFPGGREAEIPRVGFGDGTVSVPGAAVRALGRGLRSARQVLATVEEVRGRVRERLDEQREMQTERREARAEQAEQRRQGLSVSQQPLEQARNFINSINEAAGAALARTRGDDSAEATGQSTLQVRGRAFSYVRAQDEDASGFMFNVTA